ncbi:PQQ-dependent sugar dehydrogenase [Microbulbifer sp. OS29]|uniref:PQQ-dependent sugar dehydrogenase n=1 Tax=Microbulbifer okhotskensis TaxID=2926617 RepID=A0A9X2EQU7_9GAMM|nr:PQQ-dependent sugar dehydrogenase [Microbulbifer okhotskensis]MCO1335705.1 PQQ-dependent sugar dehydrogenase [Microbulbifer okhotskensis]
MRRISIAAAAVLACLILIGSSFAETRISRGAIPIIDNVKLSQVAGPIEYPWGIALLPDGTLVITQRNGKIRTIKESDLSDPIAFPVQVYFEGQGGLLDVAASPNFASDNLLYFSYSIGNTQSNRLAIGRGKWKNGNLADFEEIFKAAQGKTNDRHFGSRFGFLADGTLLATIGDGGNPPQDFLDIFAREQGQNLQTHFGSVIRIQPDGSVPDDNPFIQTKGALPEIWSFGHRNPQGLAIDPGTQQVWSNEHGPAAGDELNQLRKGGNFGWPRVTFGRDYRDGSNIAFKIADPEFVSPILAWIDTHAPGGLTIYTGKAFPQWRGYLLSAGLVTHDLRVIDPEGDALTGEQRIVVGERVRDSEVGADGTLYILTDGPQGKLLRVDPN